MTDITEWLKQSEFDLDTASYMYEGGRYFYAVFMCHLSMEKMLKALYLKKYKVPAPKTHNLAYLVEKTETELSEELLEFVFGLNDAGVATRYPETMKISSWNSPE